MDPDVISRLLDINYQFYQTFAGSFSATRRRLQPGVSRILGELPQTANLVDLGCGNGELAYALARRGQQGAYLGLDFSRGLLDEAEKVIAKLPAGDLRVFFRQTNLADPQDLPGQAAGVQPVDAVVAFAVLHHIPGQELRRRLLAQVAELLRASQKPASIFVVSVWQFLNSPRLAARCLPWESAGLDPAQVDPDDYLLDWRRDGTGVRYVHHFSSEALSTLAAENGFRVLSEFLSDGEGGNLGLYQIWEVIK